MEYKRTKTGAWYVDDYVNGKRCHKEAKTKKDLIAKVNKWLAEQAEKQLHNSPLFETVAVEWYNQALTQIRASTVHGYKAQCAFWRNLFAGVYIEDIDATDVTNGLKMLKTKRYAQHTIANYRAVCYSIFEFWITSKKWHGKYNPVEHAKVPSDSKPSVEREPPADWMIETVQQNHDGFGLAAFIMMYTGARLGEINALQKRDILLNEECYGVKGKIVIKKKAVWIGNQPKIEQFTKTAAGMRDVPLFSPLRSALLPVLSSLEEHQYILSGSGTPLTQSEYKARWAAYCNEHGMAETILEDMTPRLTKSGKKVYKRKRYKPLVTAHQFRHYMATACFEAKVPELVAQKILGHADISTTHKIYTHIRERLMKETATNLENYFTK